MNFLVKVASYLAVGCIILALNVWFINRARNAFFSRRLPSVIAPFEIVGQEDKEGVKGSAFARLLRAQLNRIQDEIAASNRALDAARGPLVVAQGAQEDLPRVKLIELPSRVFEPVNVEMRVGGVEVGGVLSWLHNFISEDDALRITIYYENEQATAVGSIDRGGKNSLWIDRTGSSDRKLIRDVAYSITHRVLADRQSEMGALKREEFERLLTTLRELANLNRQIALGRRPATESYARHLRELQKLVDQTPQWKELIRLTAQTAENAEDLVAAIELYKRELELTEQKVASHKELKDKIGTLRVQLAKSLRQPASAWISKMVGADFDSKAPKPRIGILGGTPFQGILAQSIEIIGDAPEQRSDAGMSEYITSLVSAVQLVAPDAAFIFAPVRESLEPSQLLSAIARLAEQDVDVILISLRLDMLGGAELWADTINPLADLGILTVISAGNQGKEPIVFEGSPLLDQVIIAAAVDEKGLPSAFSQRGEKIFWAPGERIPVRIAKEKTTVRSGTGYSAAIAAGVAARFMREHPELAVDRVIELLRAESIPVETSNGPPVINLRAALEAAKEKGATSKSD